MKEFKGAPKGTNSILIFMFVLFMIVGVDGLGATVFLRDTSGKEFKTSNTPVVSAVMEEIKTTLDERIKEVETQIKF